MQRRVFHLIREAKNEDFDILNEMVKEMDQNYKFDDTNPFFKCIVYLVDNTIQGFLKYSLIYENLEIDYIYVSKEYRGRNIATEMIKHIENENVQNISLEVNETNKEAIKLYKKNGFVEKSVKKNYYGSASAILMVKEHDYEK